MTKYTKTQINKRSTKGYTFIGYKPNFGGRDELFFETKAEAEAHKKKMKK